MCTPFNEEARDLRIQNKPLWLHQRDTPAPSTTQEVVFDSFHKLPRQVVECLVHRDNLYFDLEYIDAFMTAAQKLGRSRRAASAPGNRTFNQPVSPLSTSFSWTATYRHFTTSRRASQWCCRAPVRTL